MLRGPSYSHHFLAVNLKELFPTADDWCHAQFLPTLPQLLLNLLPPSWLWFLIPVVWLYPPRFPSPSKIHNHKPGCQNSHCSWPLRIAAKRYWWGWGFYPVWSGSWEAWIRSLWLEDQACIVEPSAFPLAPFSIWKFRIGEPLLVGTHQRFNIIKVFLASKEKSGIMKDEDLRRWESPSPFMLPCLN